MTKMKNVPVSLSFRCLNSSFYLFVGPIPWLYHTLQRFLLLNTLFLLLSSILPADIDLGKRKGPVLMRSKFSFTNFLRNPLEPACVANVPARFRSKEQKTRVKDRAKMARIKERRSHSIFRAAKTENPVFAPTPNGNACYAGCDFYPDLGSDKSSERNFCSRFSEFISEENQW